MPRTVASATCVGAQQCQSSTSRSSGHVMHVTRMTSRSVAGVLRTPGPEPPMMRGIPLTGLPKLRLKLRDPRVAIIRHHLYPGHPAFAVRRRQDSTLPQGRSVRPVTGSRGAQPSVGGASNQPTGECTVTLLVEKV